MANNGNGIRKLSDALKKAAEEKDKAFQKDQEPLITPPPAPFTTPETKQASREMPVYETGEKTERPVISAGVSKKIVAYHNPNSAIAEQFRVIRMHICSYEKARNVTTFAVTSPNKEEGKTVTAVNLSAVMAQDLGKPVLLIDCNMRKPAVDSLLGLRGSAGLSEVLSGSLQLKDALVKTEIANLTVLPAGQASANPNELLASDKMKTVLAELKTQFEAIILDTPAVIPYADPRILGKLVDGVILVIRAGKTRREVVTRAESVLKSVGVNILGYVLTGVEYHIPEYIHRHL